MSEEQDSGRPPIGTRVVTISHSDEEKIYIFGYGTYVGDEVPPKGTPGPLGDMSDFEAPIPKIELDDGKIVWACFAHWSGEEDFKRRSEAEDFNQEVVVIDKLPTVDDVQSNPMMEMVRKMKLDELRAKKAEKATANES